MTQAFHLDEGYVADIVLHTAEKSPYGQLTEGAENDFFTHNLTATQYLCAAIDQWDTKPKAFVFISSVCVYGAKEGVLINENHPLNGKSAYAKSKIAAEDFLIDWAYQHKITLSILRLPVWIADHHPQGILGTLFSAIRTGEYMAFGKGQARRSMIWAADIVDLFAKIPQIEGIYNLTDGIHPSCKALERVIARKLHVKSTRSMPLIFARPLALLGDWIGNPFSLTSAKLEEVTENLTFDDNKARMIFGWKPSNVLEKLAELKN